MGARGVAVAVMLGALVLAGCAAGSDDAPAPGRTVSTPAEPSPTPSGLPTPPGLPTASLGGEVTLTGVVVEGVEANCLLLDAPGGAYLLIARAGVDRALFRVNAKITVRGHVDRSIMTTCQQGRPFLVSEVRPD